MFSNKQIAYAFKTTVVKKTHNILIKVPEARLLVSCDSILRSSPCKNCDMSSAREFMATFKSIFTMFFTAIWCVTFKKTERV